MRKQRTAQIGRTANRRPRSEKLGCHRAEQSNQAQRSEEDTHAVNDRRLPPGNAAIDDCGDNQRNKKLKDGFQHFKQRCKHTFTAICTQKSQQFFHNKTPIDR